MFWKICIFCGIFGMFCFLLLFWYVLTYLDFIWCYVDIFWYYLMLFWYYFIFEEAGPYRARRGAGTSLFGAYFSKNRHSPHLQHSSGLGNSTPWSASSRRCDHTNSHQNPAYVALYHEKSLFSIVYRGATASGTVPRAPGRSTCIGHTKDELRRLYGGRVMIIWMRLRRVQHDFATSESAQFAKFRFRSFKFRCGHIEICPAK